MSTTHAHPPNSLLHSLVTQEHAPRSSPTLMDPDMILPNHGRNYSPNPLASSPTFNPDLESPLNDESNESQFFYGSPGGSTAEVGVAKAVIMPFRMKPPPPTTIVTNYHDFEHGSALSDIYEEESTPKSKKARSRSPSPARSFSPTSRLSALSAKKRNRLSNVSDSSTGSDFDLSKTMNARLAADLARADEDITDIEGLDSKRNSMITNGDDEMNLLNQRAERILAHAKKRLTHMEDNLSKARTSVYISPRSSPIQEYEQPGGGLYRSLSQGNDRRVGPGSHFRKSKPPHPVLKSLSGGHSRVLSETSVPSNFSKQSRSPEIRSASALDYGRNNNLLLVENSNRNYKNGHSPASSRSYNSPLKVLQEEEGSTSTTKTSPESPKGLGITSSGSKESLDARRPSSGSIQRSSSQSSTRSARELREQMSDLKSKISGLKTKAQASNLRRMNQARTPSPLTHAAEQWYTGAPEYKEGGSPINNNAGLGWSPARAEGPSSPRSPRSPQLPREIGSPHDSAFAEGEVATPVSAAFRSEVARSDVNTPHLHRMVPQAEIDQDENNSNLPESHYEDAPDGLEDDDTEPIAASEEEQIYLNEALEESLHDEPEVPPIPEELLTTNGEFERHEDRIDAFDYENMFLHSALGNYAQSGIRNRSRTESSESSDSSVETRRAANMTPPAEYEEEDEYEDSEGSEDSDDGRADDNRTMGRDTEGRAARRHSAIMEEDEPPTPRALRPPQAPWARSARSNSMESTSTMATFATAPEGGQTENDDEENASEILNWGNSHQPQTSSRPPSAPIVTKASSRSPHVNGAGNLLTPPQYSPKEPPKQSRQAQHQPGNTEILMASLITLADPTFQMPSGPNRFADVDKELVIALLRGVGATCSGILKSERNGDVYEAKVARRRLDAARGVLEGMLEFDDLGEEEGEYEE